MDDSVKRDAYMKGLKLKNTGLDEETIYARLEKQGVPGELAKEVAHNVFLQRQVDAVNNQQPVTPFASRGSLIRQLIEELRFWSKTGKSK